MNSLNTIPNEIILLILDNFESTSDLKVAKAICKKWRDSVNYFMKSRPSMFSRLQNRCIVQGYIDEKCQNIDFSWIENPLLVTL